MALLVITALQTPAHAEIVFTDIKGREVTLERPARHVVVDDARMIIALSFLTSDPVELLAGWPHDVNRLGQAQYAQLRARFPSIAKLPKVSGNNEDMAVEPMIAAEPDLVLLSVFSRASQRQIDQLHAAGIPVAFVDFLTDPLGNTDRSLKIIGQAIGREPAANSVTAFRTRHLDMIRDRIAESDGLSKPKVYIETHASYQEPCCNSPGEGNLGRFITLLHAKNIGDVLGERPFGQILLEHVVVSEPDVYIATGGAYMASRGGLVIGSGISEDRTEDAMRRLLARPGFSELPAVRNGRVHGMAKQLFDPVLDILALELMARWIHPEIFSDLDVEASRDALNRMSAIKLEGHYWTD
ncbi:ABC transporter substrate-binding protein [Afifella marina]|uniref:ABC transporter substrate-binding protein n=1 Tax=Afifella marina TaxID=1080 RepID=UPI001474C763|nr:ABC transporter substrate-binding protein [Afifella marina]